MSRAGRRSRLLLVSPRLPVACGALFFALLLPGFRGAHLQGAAAPPPSQSDGLTQLAHSIGELLNTPVLERATFGIAVHSLDRDQPIYQLNARKLLLPSSAMKIVTLAAAADQLGWDYTFSTRLVGTGPIRHGALAGDLVVIGTGDPSIDDWDGQATALFHQWADLLKAAGITRVDGRIVGDDNAFTDEPLGAGWAWDDLAASYATAVGALQYNENTAQLVIAAGRAAGEPARIEINPPSAPVSVRNAVTTTPPSVPVALLIRPSPRGPSLDVRGTVPLNSVRHIRNVSVENPTLYFANAMRRALAANGIEVKGATVDVDDLPAPVPVEGLQPLLVHQSAPLANLAATMMKMSQNLYAETLLRAMGARDVGFGSFETGRSALQRTLATWGISPSDLMIADGSGLSRYNLLTAEALVAILARVAADERLRDRFAAALPVAGRDGTLSERMRHTAAEGNLRAKTGSMSGARSLAGYVTDADGERLAFAIIANNYDASSDTISRALDGIAIQLASLHR
ncbi:MAG TPA: D-alanyl-D-alanine carboxypeptidase/D-alanyl-D-alanine-endopeptidase [Vicinamibacterales bacterium]